MKKNIISLYIKYKEYINYIIFGGLATCISLGIYYISVFTFLDPLKPVQLQLANILSWLASVTFQFFTNRKFVFEQTEANIFIQMIKFASARVATLLIEMGLMAVFVSWLGFNDKIFKIVVQVIVIVLNYVFSKLFVFNK